MVDMIDALGPDRRDNGSARPEVGFERISGSPLIAGSPRAIPGRRSREVSVNDGRPDDSDLGKTASRCVVTALIGRITSQMPKVENVISFMAFTDHDIRIHRPTEQAQPGRSHP